LSHSEECSVCSVFKTLLYILYINQWTFYLLAVLLSMFSVVTFWRKLFSSLFSYFHPSASSSLFLSFSHRRAIIKASTCVPARNTCNCSVLPGRIRRQLADVKLSNRLLIWFPETKLINNTTFWGVTLRSLVDVHRCWGSKSKQEVGLLLAGYWLCLLIDPEDAGSMVLWNVSELLQDYTD
jgi:hypothetical protein